MEHQNANSKKKGRKKGTKKMFTFRVEEKHHETLKEIAIYLNNITNLQLHNY